MRKKLFHLCQSTNIIVPFLLLILSKFFLKIRLLLSRLKIIFTRKRKISSGIQNDTETSPIAFAFEKKSHDF